MTDGPHKLGYASSAPTVSRSDADCFVDGAILVLRNGAATPDRCVRCNDPAEGFSVPTSFRPPLMVEGGVFYPLFVVVQLFTRPSVRVRLAVCAGCRVRYRRATRIAAIVAALSAILVAAGVARLATAAPGSEEQQLGFAIVLVGFVSVVFSLRAWLRTKRILRLGKMTSKQVWLTGAGKVFLASLATQ